MIDITYPTLGTLSEGCRSVSDSPAKNASSDVEDMKKYLYKALETQLVRQ